MRTLSISLLLLSPPFNSSMSHPLPNSQPLNYYCYICTHTHGVCTIYHVNVAFIVCMCPGLTLCWSFSLEETDFPLPRSYWPPVVIHLGVDLIEFPPSTLACQLVLSLLLRVPRCNSPVMSSTRHPGCPWWLFSEFYTHFMLIIKLLFTCNKCVLPMWKYWL